MPALIFDRERLASTLEASLIEVLETMFFASVSRLADPEGEGPTLQPGQQLGAHLRFSGGCPGEFAFSIETSALAGMALDFLGREHPAASAAECSSIVCELGNMVCGSILSRLESDSVFRLSSPCLDDGRAASQFPVDAVGGRFSIVSGSICAWIHLDTNSSSLHEL